MKRKSIFLNILFIVILCSSVFITKHHIEREYKIDSWGNNYDFKITKFDVMLEKDLSLNIFDNTFYAYITIEGIAKNDIFPVFVDYVHKSERVDVIDGQKVAVIEFSPVLSYKMFGNTDGETHNHTEKFKYKLNSYNYDVKKYIFKCGNFEEVVSFYSGK